MLEILSPAGSPEGVIAAVQNGADAIYVGFGDYNARRNAKNFTTDDFRKAAEYCRVRGVKIYVTLNTLVSDRELPAVAEQARIACRYGADAIIVQDLGVLRAVRQAAPEVPVHASTQMSINNLEGVKIAAAMGISRVVLARELSGKELAYICKHAPIETEVFAHGALCMSHSGQCYMSAVIGRRSGNRGLCAQPCRLNYSTGGHAAEYLLSLKDNCLIDYLEELEKIGVSCIKIEGRMRRPEYTAIVTGIYSKAVKERKPPSADDMKALINAFSRQGFTDGYYTGKRGSGMFGIREEEKKGDQVIFATARKNYLHGEYQRVPVRFVGIIRHGEPVKLAAADDRGNSVSTQGEFPEPAFHKEMTAASLQTQLHKTGGTPFYCVGVRSVVDSGLSVPISGINKMRRDLLSELMEKRKYLEPRREGEFIAGYRLLNREDKPVLTASVMKLTQLSKDMAALKPHILYVPADELVKDTEPLMPFLEDPDITVAVRLPRVILDSEKKKVTEFLGAASELGIREALIGNIGHLQYVKSLGFVPRGDFGLNIFNSQALRTLRDLGFSSATLSFELRLEAIRDLSKMIDTELIVYGRLPLMLTENCIIKSSSGVCACDNFSGLKDRQGAAFPVVPEFDCRNVVLNSKKLFLADKRRETALLGLWAERLMFTTENAQECVAVMKRYLGRGDYAPGSFTRGLYYRGVE
ncbi:MAG: U32 family peptidase [Clostridiales bacterium]|nr:U32 family peptidase [Clostridiales bacterium]